jgi:Flp pilus assembly protein TadG
MLQFSTRAIPTTFQRFLRDARGASAIEYAAISSGVSIVIVATIVGSAPASRVIIPPSPRR